MSDRLMIYLGATFIPSEDVEVEVDGSVKIMCWQGNGSEIDGRLHQSQLIEIDMLRGDRSLTMVT